MSWRGLGRRGRDGDIGTGVGRVGGGKDDDPGARDRTRLGLLEVMSGRRGAGGR